MAHGEYSTELPNTVVIGGGGGASMAAEALRPYLHEKLSVVVGTFDSGGNTGDLRDHYGGFAVGDVRQNCRALSRLGADALMGYEAKPPEGNGTNNMNVHGVAPGNLLLANLVRLFGDDPARLIAAYSDAYQIEGKVLPVTTQNRELRLTTPWGETLYGEHAIDETEYTNLKGSKLWFDQETILGDQAAAALEEADMAVIAPGDWTTSVGSTLAVPGVVEKLARVPAVIWTPNLMNKPTQTRDWTALDHLEQFEEIMGGKKIIDRILVNTALPHPDLLAEQEAEGSTFVRPEVEAMRAKGYEVIEVDSISHVKAARQANDLVKTPRAAIVNAKIKYGRIVVREWLNNEFPDKSDR